MGKIQNTHRHMRLKCKILDHPQIDCQIQPLARVKPNPAHTWIESP